MTIAIIPAEYGEPARSTEHCTECPHHRVEEDPDLKDWSNHDDVKVKCSLTSRPDPYVAIACRPYNVRHEDRVPDWCPLATAQP